MRYIADLHIHSPFSRATSKASTLVGLAAWSRVKGINLLGTGDFTHPGWFARIREELEPAEPGFFKLNGAARGAVDSVLPQSAGPSGPGADCRFVLTAEISSIYKRHGKVRKVHNLLFVPDLEAAARINTQLAGIGNIHSDGRPILGLDSRNLLEILLEQAPEGFLVPAHIWTPWFSMFGSKSGFDSIEECFDDLAPHVFALETGLSSDPDMNRLVSALDRFALISNSDCHSPGKLGREANIFDTDFDFYAMRNSLKDPGRGFLGTIEFFPEEGKYHYDGHRKCKVCLDPVESRKLKNICPVCQRPLTIGVMYRVMELADRIEPVYPDSAPGFHSLIPLAEVLSELLGRGPATKGVMAQYWRVVSLFGSEFQLFLETDVEEIKQRYSPVLAEAVARIRAGRVIRNSGYDGEFGVITVFAPGELDEIRGQHSLFAARPRQVLKKKKKITAELPLFAMAESLSPQAPPRSGRDLNPEQEAAASCPGGKILVQAGPGTGKTHTLIARLARLLGDNTKNPARVAAITFTNRAADELRERLRGRAGARAEQVFVGTFHGFCLHWLRQRTPDLAVVGDQERALLLRILFPEAGSRELHATEQAIAAYFQDLTRSGPITPQGAVVPYLDRLTEQQGIDLDAVIPTFVQRLNKEPEFRQQVTDRLSYLFVDEFQDLNQSQYQLVQLLGKNTQIFAIGDPDQAIYGFRGSSPQFFYKYLTEDRARRISLVRNYRSAAVILSAAGAVISHNPCPNGVPRRPLVPVSGRKAAIEYYQAPSVKAEAEFVVQRIEELLGGISSYSINTGRGGDQDVGTGLSFGDIAVLYRSSQQAGPLSEALTRRGIPIQVVGVRPFYLTEAVRPLYYWLRAAVVEELSMSAPEYLNLLRELPGIGAASLKKLEARLGLGDIADFFERAATCNLPATARSVLTGLEQNLCRFRGQVAENGPVPLLNRVIKELDIDPDQAEVARFLELAGSFGSDLGALVRYLKRNVAGTVYDDQAEAVALMTLHKAKGLEFPVVFITGLEEGVLPWFSASQEEAGEGDIEEERRLFYVGLTRARRSLVLTGSASRTIFGGTHDQQPSRFLAEIPEGLVTRVARPGPRRKKPAARQMKLFQEVKPVEG
ncbi:MAG: UvrD-helicase domain-containing protein [Desulfobacterales bacterium]|nr:UvrD-helicase domain-containing protein [Desulfobacterales bacterium]